MLRKILLALLLLAPLAYPGNLAALSCAVDSIAPEENIQNRDYVFTATLESADISNNYIHTPGDTYNRQDTYKVNLAKNYKGGIGTTVTLQGNDWDGFRIEYGKEYLFLLSEKNYEPQSNTYTRGLCDYTDYFVSGSEEYDGYLSILGADSSPISPGSSSKFPFVSWPIASGVLAVLLVVSLVLLAQKRKSARKKH